MRLIVVESHAIAFVRRADLTAVSALQPVEASNDSYELMPCP